MIYLDDTARASHNVNTMRAGNIKLASLMREKQLEILASSFLELNSSKLPAGWILKKVL